VPKQTNTHAETILHQNLPLLEVAEPWLLDTVLADAGAARWIVTRLSDRVAIVAPGQVDALLARLRKLGHTPKVLEG
jgi:hypothetical protein